MKTTDNNDQVIIQKLELLQNQAMRSPEKTAAGRIAFLKESKTFSENVSLQRNRRLKNWNKKEKDQFLIHRKERFSMLSTFTSIIIAIGLLLGGSGITVAAAQSSLPGDMLYDIKLLSENALLDLTSDPESKLDLALNIIDRRVNEVQEILLSGEIPTEETQTRYQEQVEQTIILALNLPSDKVIQAFEKIQTRLQTQQELLAQIQIHGSENADGVLLHTRSMIQERLQLLENELGNRQQTQQQLQNQEQFGESEQQNNSPTGQDTSSAPGVGGSNPWTTGTPTPGSAYGPGETNNPWTTGTPTPGSGYGPGDGTCVFLTCTPSAGENGNNGNGNMNQLTSTPNNGNGNGKH